jgi:hypothetical protein
LLLLLPLFLFTAVPFAGVTAAVFITVVIEVVFLRCCLCCCVYYCCCCFRAHWAISSTCLLYLRLSIKNNSARIEDFCWHRKMFLNHKVQWTEICLLIALE